MSGSPIFILQTLNQVGKWKDQLRSRVMTPEDVMAAYEAAASTHDLSATLRLIDRDALYWFSNSASHVGRAAVEQAIEHNFETITDETYRIENLRWIARSDEVSHPVVPDRLTAVGSPFAVVTASPVADRWVCSPL
jgi:hypothetical protein